MYEDLCLYINGQFLKGGGRREQDVINPATDEVIGKLPYASKEDLDLALSSAQAAFQSWRKSSPMGKKPHPAQGGRARPRARQRDRPQHHARPGQAARGGRGRGDGVLGAPRVGRRGMPAHLRASRAGSRRRRAAVRAEGADRRLRRVLAVEFPLQPGDPQVPREAKLLPSLPLATFARRLPRR